jgi:hypothetical protein
MTNEVERNRSFMSFLCFCFDGEEIAVPSELEHISHLLSHNMPI